MGLKPAIIFTAFLLFSTVANAQRAGKAIQINIDTLLNARPVSTCFNGLLKSWTKGIDGNGDGDGYLTMSAAVYCDNRDPHALPDNSLIPASDMHPAIKLHYNNRDSVGQQARYVSGEGGFAFNVPKKKYQGMYLSVTSSEGPSQLQIQLIYNDGTEIKDFTLPDYYNDITTGDENFSYLLHNLAKWGKKNIMTESDHHNIDVLNIHPNPNRVLRRIIVKKSKPGFLVFWAATGVVI
ncbi:hypothetical protein [Mucilaginibacter ginsenosidivorax]|uniref:Uncharacterized protein n=1 Tax=Mucilaginibacter ginsenosidivorax TaxID=862126 RepID=A0A5B8VZG2_9SPHI|nr:hypothetical protein [Mucilaginibacter ginsenosidivorax]QEC76025.1 hypothetical protein FSB76_08720 [Mucilaginibacter ginsenosidivorax]